MKSKLIFIAVRLITFDYYSIKRIIRQLAGKPHTVLDLGCGNGILCKFFPPSGYLGIDIDASAIKIARKNKDYSFEVADITRFKTNEKFDLVLVIGVIHHLSNEEAERAFRVIRNHLSQKGKALFIEPIPPVSKWNILGKMIRGLDKGHFIRTFNQYLQVIKNSFEVVYAQPRRGGIVDYGVFLIARKGNCNQISKRGLVLK